MEDPTVLEEQIAQYTEQLKQVNSAIDIVQGPDKDNLLVLKGEIEELLQLTRESLDSLKSKDDQERIDAEYALFKAELESEETPEVQSEEAKGSESIQEELQSIAGMKCTAPYTNKLGVVGYHNALVAQVETSDAITDINHIMVRVLFTNPTEKDMVPCPYFLDEKCNYGEEDCNFSHGYLVPFDKLKEYREPDFTSLKKGSRVLVKLPDSKMWVSSAIEQIVDDDVCVVRHERRYVSVPVHDVLPLLTNDGTESESDLSTDDDVETDTDKQWEDRQAEMVEQSLSRPGTGKLGQWEKYTKGIGSKLMAKMGYVVGTGLGKSGEGIIQPVVAQVLPAGKSLDHCMNLKEAAGGSEDLFSAEKIQKQLALKEMKRSKREYYRQKKLEKHNVFDLINNKLNKGAENAAKKKNREISSNIATTSSRQLNVERFKIAEEVREAQRRIYILSESLTRQKEGTVSHKHMLSKLEAEQRQLNSLQFLDSKVEREQNLRETKRKMTVF